MATEFTIPNVGDSINKVTIVSWLASDGDHVEAEQDLLEVETDKATVAIPANGSGYLRTGPYREGDEIAVGTIVAIIGSESDRFESYNADGVSQDAATPPSTDSPSPSTASSPPAVEASSSSNDDSIRATGVARKMADALGVELQAISGTGDHGRVTKNDVEQAASGKRSTPQPTTAPAPTAPPAELRTPPPPKTEPPPITTADDVTDRVPLKGVRKVIATRMGESSNSTARVTLIREVDATELVSLRENLKAQFKESWGFAPGYNELLAMICATGLREYAGMNARLSADGEAIEYLKRVNIGMAVDTPRGLLVGVLKDADQKSLQQLGTEFRAIVGRIREGKATPDELSGGTFTITNLGMFNVDAFTPVINLPELAILGVGRIVPKPVVKDDEIVIRKMWTLSLVFDHRLVDGAPAARFLDHVCQLIEEPHLLFLTKR